VTEPDREPAPGPTVTGLAPGYPIRTDRLLLRPWRPDELDAFHGLRGDPEVARYLYNAPLTRAESEARLALQRSVITETGQWMNLVVEVADTGEVAGDVGLCWLSAVDRAVEVGYTFMPAYHGRGYATEAAGAMVDLAFTDLGAHRVFGHLDARNTASAAVLERLGMRREAHFVENEWVKGEWTDDVVYAILATEWAARRATA
jgi:RimJ/RimL family protein N-acetyltransferase